ncbi:MAG: nucleotide-binding protein [Bacteroidota bacterium]
MEIVEIEKYIYDIEETESKSEILKIFDSFYDDFLSDCILLKRRKYIERLNQVREKIAEVNFFTWDENEIIENQVKDFIRLVEDIMNENKKIFIVHGKNSEMRNDVTSFLGKLKQEWTVLELSKNAGQTIIEKFITEARKCGYAIILFSADDEGKYKMDSEYKPRTRQNVILELGFFLGYLERKNIFILHDDIPLDIPTDFSGIVYESYDKKGAWHNKLIRELKATGQYIQDNLI